MLLLFNNDASSVSPPAARNPDLDIVFDCAGTDSAGNPDVGKLSVTTDISGIWLNKTIFASPMVVTLSQHGAYIKGILVSASPFVATSSLKGDITTQSVGMGWVRWSNIGNLDFTVGRDNIAGERPLDWKGPVYLIKKLNNKVVVYGNSGISILVPAGNSFGLNTIYRVGLKGKNAVCGDDTKHFYIDDKGQLWRLGEGLDKLDYSEYLSAMSSSVVMNYDNAKNLVYICDGTLGYVYNPETKSLGAGYVNISGFGYQGDISYFTSPATIVTPPFEICTDIYDFGTRGPKTIWSVEVGTNLTQVLSVCINHRKDKAGSFSTTPWITTNAGGVAFIPCYANEFQIKVRAAGYEAFEIDYINVSGAIHNY